MREHHDQQHATPAETVAPAAHNGVRERPVLWRPSRPEFTLFMIHEVACPACRLARQAAGLDAAVRLHVRRCGDALQITEADDLHRPGRSLSALLIMEHPTYALFRLLSERPAAAAPARFRAAAGFVKVTWGGGRRAMRAIGSADGLTPHHEVLFDAVEVCC